MSEQRGADAGQPMSLGAGLRRWFLQPPRPHGEVIEDRTVSFLELFYDLVYVVLVGQIAHTLAEDVSWSSVVDFAVVFGLIWIGWFNGAQFHELHGREDGRNRSFIFVQMGILTVLAVFTGHAASTDGEPFALTYAILLAVLFLLAGSVSALLIALVATMVSLADHQRLAALYRPLAVALLLGAVAALAIGSVRPAPWLLATLLNLVLIAIWCFAFARTLETGQEVPAPD